nr:PREDICTED: uncharacterized protein LOC109033685 [Bemisia tabaci]
MHLFHLVIGTALLLCNIAIVASEGERDLRAKLKQHAENDECRLKRDNKRDEHPSFNAKLAEQNCADALKIFNRLHQINDEYQKACNEANEPANCNKCGSEVYGCSFQCLDLETVSFKAKKLESIVRALNL